MEKELVKTFESAKKAADAAANAGGGSPESDRCIDALRQLKKIPVTTKILTDTQVGKRLRSLTKHPHSKIQAFASDLLEYWKSVVVKETLNSKKNGTTEYRNSVKVETKSDSTENSKVGKSSNNVTVKMDGVKVETKSVDCLKFSKRDLDQDIETETSKSERNTSWKTDENQPGGQTIKVERTLKDESTSAMCKRQSPVPIEPSKLTTMIKCNDPLRDKIRELLAEAFSRVSDETSRDERDEVRNILDEVDASDPIRVAVLVESVMFEKLGRSNSAQKLKYRSIMFNLKDGNNTDLRRRVLVGEVKPEKLVVMTSEEMASDARKLSNKQIKEKALFECQRGGPPKATTDQFKCGRCGQRKTTYYQLQTRSADEPMTTFVTCVNCNHHWKFC